MTNREKVIKGLEQFKADLKPFCGNHADWEKFDAGLALLKEQEAKLVRIDEDSVHCPSCGNELFTYPRQKFCDECGQEVKWDDKT